MNPADERVAELLDKWLASLELHLKYVSLDEPDYRKAQPWPEHDRPSRWIIEVAKGKARELRDQVAARIATGDATFCESLELMAFLVNLVGARVDRFIPLAEVASEVDVSTAKQPAVATPAPGGARSARAPGAARQVRPLRRRPRQQHRSSWPRQRRGRRQPSHHHPNNHGPNNNMRRHRRPYSRHRCPLRHPRRRQHRRRLR